MSKMKSIKEIEMERNTQPNFGKGITVASGFDLGAKAPLDSRLTVKTIEERNAHVSGNRAYEGMLVYVEADKKTYQLINNTWEEFGFNEEKFQQGVQPIVDKNAEQDERLDILENLVVGGEGEGLGAIVEDVAKNKADISDLKTKLAKEITDREAADTLINTEISKNKADIANLQSNLEDEVSTREEAINLINEELSKKADQADLQAEVARATGVEQGLNTRLTAVENEVQDLDIAIDSNSEAISQEVSNRKSEIARVEGLVAAEKQRAEGAEQTLQANIDKKVSKEEFNAEQTRVNNALAGKVSNEVFVEEQEKVEGLFDQVNTTLEGHGTLIDTVTALAQENKEKKADKTQVANDILAGVSQAKAYADEKLVEAKSYADNELIKLEGSLTENITAVEESVETVDGKVVALGKRVASTESDITNLRNALSNKNSNTIVVDTEDEIQTYNPNPRKGDLAFVISTKRMYIFKDEYAGDEKAVDGRLAPQGWVIFDEITSELDLVDYLKKSDAASTYRRLDTKIVEGDLATELSTKINNKLETSQVNEMIQTAVNPVNTKVDANTTAISSEVSERKSEITRVEGVLNSAKTELNSSINELDTKITTEKERALAAESKLDGRITTLNQTLEGAKNDVVANANAIEQETTNRQSAINTLDTKINNTLPVTSSVQPVDRAEGHVWIEILN